MRQLLLVCIAGLVFSLTASASKQNEAQPRPDATTADKKCGYTQIYVPGGDLARGVKTKMLRRVKLRGQPTETEASWLRARVEDALRKAGYIPVTDRQSAKAILEIHLMSRRIKSPTIKGHKNPLGGSFPSSAMEPYFTRAVLIDEMSEDPVRRLVEISCSQSRKHGKTALWRMAKCVVHAIDNWCEVAGDRGIEE